MRTIEDAIVLATHAHRGQTDKAGQPYILHPLRLMLSMKSEAERMVAVLHDVVEDSDVTIADLRVAGYLVEVIEAVELLTHPEGMEYSEYVRRIRENPLARRVKAADLQDNMNLARIAAPTAKDYARIEKYQAALEILV